MRTLVRLLPVVTVLTSLKDLNTSTGSTTGTASSSISFLRCNLVADCVCGRRRTTNFSGLRVVATGNVGVECSDNAHHSVWRLHPSFTFRRSRSSALRSISSTRGRSTSGTAWTWLSTTERHRRIHYQRRPFRCNDGAAGSISIPFNHAPSACHCRNDCRMVALQSVADHCESANTGVPPCGSWQRAFYAHTEPNYLNSSTATTTTIDISNALADNPKRSYNISYHYQPASVGWESVSPILLIHPVGIGMASWFWNPLHQAFTDRASCIGNSSGHHPALYAVNLVGCGATEQNAALTLQLSPTTTWSSETSTAHPPFQNPAPESVPWLWIRQCETLIHTVIVQPMQAGIDATRRNVTIMAQGGLAPIALALARRNPETISHLILTSPPIWTDLTTCVPESALSLNVQVLCSPLGRLAFALLETRAAVQFFSNAFLFGSRTPCTDAWWEPALCEAGPVVRPPVQIFNAGYCLQASVVDALDLQVLPQPTLILQGKEDERSRTEFLASMRDCHLVTLPGKNVLPWESPEETASAIREFILQQQRRAVDEN
jgi:pimeloyl-ACP methyl ester carboxylesterase